MAYQEQNAKKLEGAPLQRKSWSEKIAKNKQWFKDNVNYRISQSSFGVTFTNNKRKDLGMFYNVYNAQFPLDWFGHITNPLNTPDSKLSKFPAKIRPTSMLRENIDLLLGEYPLRPFAYQVDNMGEDAFNSYQDSLMKQVESNLHEHFMAVAQGAMQDAGHEFQQIPQEEQVEMPEALKERFTASYKDNQAIRGQRWMKRAIREYNVKAKLLKCFKDWLITGYAFTYKNMENGNFIYERVSPRELDYIKSPNCDFLEDAEVVIRKQLWTVSEVVDRFYDEISNKDHENLEARNWTSPATMFAFMTQNMSDSLISSNLVPIYHVVWTGKKQIKYVNYTDPLTGETQEDVIVDEDMPLIDGMTLAKTVWVNEKYEGWRVGDSLYCKLRAIPVQRNEMNNFSKCKGPYNGRLYSDTHSDNISVLELGLPFAIMYMICDYTIEKTIAKNKGKIMMIDQNAIPTGEGWNEDKFFYYAEAMGYMLTNRAQQGVDKTMNQYHVMDMSTFEHIKELINLRDSFRKGWDDTLGINPQRKAQIAPGEGLGTMNGAIAQSSVITNMIYTLFEEFVEKDLQGILDFSRFINVDGIRAIYNSDDFDTMLLDIDPNTYCNAELGLFISSSSGEKQALESYKAHIQAMLQNQVKPSTVLEISSTNNLAELKTKLKRIEQIEMEQAQQRAANEQEAAAAQEQVKEQYLKLEKALDGDLIDREWDRRDQNSMLVGEYAAISTLGTAADGDINDNGIPDAAEISKRVIAAQNIATQERLKNAEISSKERMQDKELKMRQEELATKERIEKAKNATALKNKVAGQK